MTDAACLTPLGAAILNLLEERPMHPYDMIQILQKRGEDRWVKVAPSSLYHQVERLVGRGLAEVVGTDQEGRRPQRTTYRATPHGLELLRAWISDQIGCVRNDYPTFPLALGQLASLPPEQARAELAARVADLDAHHTDMTEQLQQARDRDVPRIWLLAHEHALSALDAERRFVQGLVTDIDQEGLTWPRP